MEKTVKELYELCKKWLVFVKDCNECAYTDRIIENIIKKQDELKIKYDDEVPTKKENEG